MKFCNGILTKVSGPTADLLSTSDAKEWLRVDGAYDDATIVALVSAATSMLDGPYGEVGKALLTQRWAYSVRPQTGRGAVRFPVVPFQSLVSLSYFDADNTAQTLTVGDFEIFKEDDWAYVRPQIDDQWPTMYAREDALTVTADCGFGGAGDVPESIIVAAKMMIASLYEHRGDTPMEVPPMIQRLIDKDRLCWIAA